MDAESSVRFGHVNAAAAAGAAGAAAAAHQVIPAAAGGMFPGAMASFLAGFGMAPAGMFLPGRPPVPAAGYGAAAPWNGVAAPMGSRAPPPPQQPGAGGRGERAMPAVLPQRGPWTQEEDDTLKEMVVRHGDRKWAAIARYLPGRIGKQCRERWTNHLRPDIKKSVWTDEDDAALIEAHKTHGNRWSMIARFLPGRSENAVKNHWNATRRSLKAKRRLKKKRNAVADAAAPAASGNNYSILEEYIRGLYPNDLAAPTPPPASPPSHNNNNLGYGEVVSPTSAGATAGMMGTPPSYLTGGVVSPGASSSNNNLQVGPMMNQLTGMPLFFDLNAYYTGVGHGEPPLNAMAVAEVKPPPPMTMMIDHEGQQQAAAASYANHQMTMNMISYPFLDNLAWQSSVLQGNDTGNGSGSGNGNVHYNAGLYYEDSSAAGGGRGSGSVDGSGGGLDDVDVVQMASREFLTPSEDEVTLDLARFM